MNSLDKNSNSFKRHIKSLDIFLSTEVFPNPIYKSDIYQYIFYDEIETITKLYYNIYFIKQLYVFYDQKRLQKDYEKNLLIKLKTVYKKYKKILPNLLKKYDFNISRYGIEQFIDSIKLYVDELLKNKDNKDEKDKKKKIEQNTVILYDNIQNSGLDHSTIIKLLKKLKTFAVQPKTGGEYFIYNLENFYQDNNFVENQENLKKIFTKIITSQKIRNLII